jgi:hypothetical protein
MSGLKTLRSTSGPHTVYPPLGSFPALQAAKSWALTFFWMGGCKWDHFLHSALRQEGEPAGRSHTRPGRRGATTARGRPALAPLGPEWQSRARTIGIASHRPAPRLLPIGCRWPLGPSLAPSSRLCDRAAARSGVGGQRPRVTPVVVTS